MRKTTKKKITTTAKRVVKPPSQSVVLSLMACILIVGGPAIVSTIDDSYNQSYELESALSVKSTNDFAIANLQITEINDVSTTVDEKATIIRDGNSYSIVHGAANTYGWIYIKDFDNGMITDGVTKFVITTSEKCKVDIRFLNGDLLDRFTCATDATGMVHTLELSSVDIIKIKSYGLNDVHIVPYTFKTAPFIEDVFTLTVSAYGTVTVPYGEIIIGATGAILIMCALFATPWFGIGGMAKPKRS